MQEYFLVGWITGLRIFWVPEFGTKSASRSNAEDSPLSSAALLRTSLENLLPIIAKAILSRCKVITNRDHRRLPRRHPGLAAFVSMVSVF